MTRISEQRDVQDQLVNYLMGIGWHYLPPHDCLLARGEDERQTFLLDVLVAQLAALNGWQLDDERIAKVIRRLHLLPANIEGNEDFLKALRGHWTTYSPAEQRELNLTLIDFDQPERNTYHFTQEMWFADQDRRRMDMVLFINGLPVILIENKAPTLEDPGRTGFDQVQLTYTERIPEFVKYPAAFAVCAHKLEYGPTWNPRLNAFYTWKVDGQAYGLESLSKSFFDCEQVLRLIRDYTIFYRSDDSTQKFLMRPHQMRTVQKIVERVANGLDSLEAPDTGLEWHTQGSGKTLTMIVAAHLLRRQPELENPTLLMIVDRLELETQMLQNLEAFGFPAVVRAQHKQQLRQLLRDDYRGLIVTTIHKFDRMPNNINLRRNVICLIDEAHRSQEGDLGIYLRAALPNAFLFGFTGTPIDKGAVGKGTFETFGQYDPEGYHDKYSINESIEDNTTVPLYYTLAPTDIWVDKLALEGRFADLREEFFDRVDEEGASSQEALSRLLQRADKLLAVLKAPARVGAITEHIANHFQANVLPLGFKALVVTPDREACALYKQALDQYLQEDWSVVVFSGDHNDRELLRQYHLDEDTEKRIRKAFRDPTENPKILIVTEKLLTGYDAPVAYAMYLDKPLKDHTLLQAIARVNRPFPDKKSGLIVDYIGIFENLQRALSFDQKSITRGLIDLELLKTHFQELLAQCQTAVEPVQPNNTSGRIDRIIQHFFEPERREQFTALFQELQDTYEILSPDPCLRPYIDDYVLLTQIYLVVYNTFDPKAHQQRLEHDLLKKTDYLIREHVSAEPVAAPLPLYPINRNIADVVKADNVSEQVKVVTLHRSLIDHIQQQLEVKPYLVSIAEAVGQVIEQLHQRQISVQTALAELENKAEKMAAAEEEHAHSNLDNLAFSLRMVLRGSALIDHDQTDTDGLTTELSQFLNKCEGWPYNDRLQSQLRADLYRCLMPQMRKPIVPNDVKALVDDILRMHRIIL